MDLRKLQEARSIAASYRQFKGGKFLSFWLNATPREKVYQVEVDQLARSYGDRCFDPEQESLTLDDTMEFVAKYRAVDPDVYITVSIMTREWKKGRIVVKSRKKVVLEPGDGVLSVIGRWAAEKKFVVHDEKYFVRLFKFPSKKKKVKQK